MYRTISLKIIITVFFVCVLSELQHVSADSLKTVIQVKETVTLPDKKVIAQDESLAVELLLKDLEITVDDSSGDSAMKPLTGKQNVKVVSSVKKNDKAIKMPSVKNDSPDKQQKLSYRKIVRQIWTSIPGIEFLRKQGKIILIVIILALMIAGIAMFLYWRKDFGRFLTTGRLSIMDKEVQRACDYIEENYANKDLTIETICTTLVTGEAFLQALFNQELGISVENFIIQVRVNRVKHFVNKDLSLENEVLAEMTGFTDAKTMEEQFQLITGASLDTLRKSLSAHE